MYFIYTTFPTLESANSIVSVLLEENLIACANVLPSHTSFYKWNNEIQKNQEHGCFLKAKCHKSVEKKLLELHPYTCPCFLVFKPEHVNTSFLEWVCSS